LASEAGHSREAWDCDSRRAGTATPTWCEQAGMEAEKGCQSSMTLMGHSPGQTLGPTTRASGHRTGMAGPGCRVLHRGSRLEWQPVPGERAGPISCPQLLVRREVLGLCSQNFLLLPSKAYTYYLRISFLSLSFGLHLNRLSTLWVSKPGLCTRGFLCHRQRGPGQAAPWTREAP
jgi:hypothetical protein